jgi:hypothetical protein
MAVATAPVEAEKREPARVSAGTIPSLEEQLVSADTKGSY